jgi:hypothetical protein
MKVLTKHKKRSSTKHANLISSRSPVATLLALALVLAAVALGLWLRPVSQAAEVVPEIRIECNINHFGPDDPIVYPGQPGASHMHSFYGNSSTNAYTTTASLQSSPATCNYLGNFDRSSYWVPSLYATNADGTTTRFSDTGQSLVAYYRKAGGANGPKVTPFPAGLRMIAGDPHAQSAQPSSITSWDCGDGGPDYGYVPDCTNATSGKTPVGFVTFPNCWNGKDLDSADHRSHMAYSDPITGACPAGYPVSFARLEYEVWENGTTSGPNYSLSSGGKFSLHGDFFAGWDPRLLGGLVDKCMNASILSCHTTQVWNNGDVTVNGGTFLFNLASYSGAPLPSPTLIPKIGDFNGDNAVNVLDLSVLFSAWGKPSATADLNKDGVVNILDLSLLLSHWGT